MTDVKRMKSLVEISEIVTKSDNFFEIKDLVIDKMLSVVHPTKACVNLFYNRDYSYSHLVCSATLSYIPKLFPKNEKYGSKIDFNLYPKYIHEAVFEKKVVVVKNIFDDDRAKVEASMAQNENYIGRVVLPFIYNDETIGFMTCYLTRDDEIKQEDIDFMTQVASLMALSVSTTEKNRDIKALVHKLRTSISNINKGSTMLYSTNDVYAYLDRMVHTIIETTESEYAFIGVYHTDKEGVVLGQKLGMAHPSEDMNYILSVMPSIIKKKHIFECKNEEPMQIGPNITVNNHMFVKIELDQKTKLILFCAGSKVYSYDDSNTISILSKQIKNSINTYEYFLTEEKQKKMEEDLSIISKQQALIMNDSSELSSFYDNQIYYYHKPAKIVGGDFYTAVDVGEKIVFILGDVMGHGIVSNYIVAMIKGAFEVLSRHNDSASDILKKMNSYLYDELDSLDIYLTAIVGVFNKKDRTLEISNAGHYFPIITYKNGKICSDQEGERGVPIGVLDILSCKDVKYQMSDIKEICFFTDGILEMTNCVGEKFGVEGLEKFLNENKDSTKEETLRNIKETIDTYVDNIDKQDDVLILFVKNEN